jgi:hypothetical protein
MIISKTVKNLINLFTMLAFSGSTAIAQDVTKSSQPTESKRTHIHVVYFGGNDCPPCIAFRGTEFVKLQKSEAFTKMEWTFVTKTVSSPVPSGFFLPTRVKPLGDKLRTATAGIGGSAQVVILVNDEVYDVFSGSGDADFYEKMVASVLNKEPYPRERCLQRTSTRGCEKKG